MCRRENGRDFIENDDDDDSEVTAAAIALAATVPITIIGMRESGVYKFTLGEMGTKIIQTS